MAVDHVKDNNNYVNNFGLIKLIETHVMYNQTYVIHPRTCTHTISHYSQAAKQEESSDHETSVYDYRVTEMENNSRN